MSFVSSVFPSATILGYPRIGDRRQLKRALESLWAGRSNADEFAATTHQLRAATRERLAARGLGRDDSSIPESFSWYDQVLDAAVTFGVIPDRFRSLDWSGDLVGAYSTVARGVGDDAPLEMTKWFNTNYHYLVPEVDESTPFVLNPTLVTSLVDEARAQGFVTRPTIVGPMTFLALSKAATSASTGFDPLSRLDELVGVYVELLAVLAERGVQWVQLDEPALVSENLSVDATALEQAFVAAYARLTSADARPNILVTAPFASLGALAEPVLNSGVEAVAVDLVHGDLPAAVPDGVTLVAGVVNGRNVWRCDLDQARRVLEGVHAGSVAVSTSTSLQHVPHTVADEPALDPTLASWLAFADEKISEVVTLARGLTQGWDSVASELDDARTVLAARAAAPGVTVPHVRERVAGITHADLARTTIDGKRASIASRVAQQQERLQLPPLPTTTIGSFPQTADIRRARAQWTRGDLTDADYQVQMRTEIERVIRLQEDLGLDVLVHGEAERNDMVQYFAEHLDGFVVTENGWVQSYGSRCTRPSIQWGDVSRPAPITTQWATYAQSLTPKPVKGMLTGPVTIMAWSFIREDLPLAETAKQIGLALRDEVGDLEAANIAVIQVDEPALRELLPLKKADHKDYLDWSVSSFRLATTGVRPDTQIHTHLCYSEFNDIIDAIDHLGADVTSIEAARSRMEVLGALAASGFGRGVGPGIYDIHSPRVPSVEELAELLDLAVRSVRPELLWVNPDCGLKTRGYDETVASLRNLVQAAHDVRAHVAVTA